MDANNYTMELLKQPPKTDKERTITLDDYENEKKFVLKELADTQFSTDRFSHDLLKDLVQPFVDDKEVMLAALVNNAYIAHEASARLKADKEFMVQAVQSCSGIFREASVQLKDDIEVAQHAAWAQSSSFQYASDRIRSTPDLIAVCCADSSSVLNSMHSSVRDNPSRFLELLKEIEPHHSPSKVIHYASEAIQKLVGDEDPVKCLQAHLLHEKLNNACALKVEATRPKIKI